MLILGISAFYHDSAVCLVEDGKIIFAAQEERYTRKKHDSSFPTNAIRDCFKNSGITLENIDLLSIHFFNQRMGFFGTGNYSTKLK